MAVNQMSRFLCTDASLSDEQVLHLYVQRWNIEVFFRETKRRLALNKYQIRSEKGIQRLWMIASKIQEEQVAFIFHFAQNGGSIPALLEMIR